MNEDDYYTHVPLNVVGTLKAITPERLARLLQAEVERDEARARLDCVAERDRLAIAAVDGVQQLRIDLAAARAERDALRERVAEQMAWEGRAVASMNEASLAAGVGCCDQIPGAIDALRDDLAAARALLKRQPPSDCRPCHECGAIWWSDEHGCWFVGGQRERTALAGKDAP